MAKSTKKTGWGWVYKSDGVVSELFPNPDQALMYMEQKLEFDNFDVIKAAEHGFFLALIEAEFRPIMVLEEKGYPNKTKEDS